MKTKRDIIHYFIEPPPSSSRRYIQRGSYGESYIWPSRSVGTFDGSASCSTSCSKCDEDLWNKIGTSSANCIIRAAPSICRPIFAFHKTFRFPTFQSAKFVDGNRTLLFRPLECFILTTYTASLASAISIGLSWQGRSVTGQKIATISKNWQAFNFGRFGLRCRNWTLVLQKKCQSWKGESAVPKRRLCEN